MAGRNQGWRDHIQLLGGLSDAVAHFTAQQELMLQANDVLSAYIAN